jgi:hypothetical protein
VEDGKSKRDGWDVRTVLERSGFLRLSSDRAAVRVKRIDPATGSLNEWRVDCTGHPAGSDLWLRDGDVIEVPDRATPIPEPAVLPPLEGTPVPVRTPDQAVPASEPAFMPPVPRAGVIRVLGAVKRPGTVTLPAGVEMDIIDAIAESGGLAENARSEVEFTRDGQTRRLLWDDLKAEADPAKKIKLQDGDLLEVKPRVF